MVSLSQTVDYDAQRRVQWLTNIQSALTILQSCLVLLIVTQFGSIASCFPHFRLFFGAISSSC